MAVRKVLIWPDPELRKKAEPVTDVHSKETKQIIRDLHDTATYFDENINGTAGLAAPQIGYLKQIMLVNIDEKNYGYGTNGPKIFINPKFTLKEKEFTWDEACLSVPDEYGPVTRAEHIVMEYLDVDGKKQSLETEGWASGVFQHEQDHLEGILWVDYQGRLKQKMVTKRMNKLRLSLDDDGPYRG